MFLSSGTEGLVRGQAVSDSGFPIRIPVGAETLGRIINVIGEPIDERGPVETDKLAAIHADAPEFVDMSVEQEILATGIKVVDLLAPYVKGGKIGKCPNNSNPKLEIRFGAEYLFGFCYQVCSEVLVSAKLYSLWS